MGDFNMVRFANEKDGGIFDAQSVGEFVDCLDAIGLLDLNS